MTALSTSLLLIAAGAALVVQNTLMARISLSASGVLLALVINSAVGLILLLSLFAGKSGMAGFAELVNGFKSWMLLPGLLGAFFVFAGINGYQQLGASRTIAILVASQLVAALGYDIWRSDTGYLMKNLSALLGAALLVAGAVLVAGRRD